MKRLAYFAAVILPFTLPGAARAQHTCAPSHLQDEAQRVLALQKHLLAIPVQPMDESVSPEAAAQLASFKSAVSIAVHDWMVCRVPSDEPASLLQRHLANWLGANRPGTQPATRSPGPQKVSRGIYGANLHISARQLNDRPRFLAIQAGLGIPCGNDNVLMLYERMDHRWRRVLLWQSNKYNEISGAFGDFFDYALLPPYIAGGWDVAVAHGTPWCTSRFSGFRIDLLHISENGRPPRLLFHKTGAYSRDGYYPRLRATSHGFQMRINTSSLDTHLMVKTSIYRYYIHDGDVHRVQPVAITPAGFVDAWLQSSWTAASQWTASSQIVPLHHLHATFSSPSHFNTVLYTQFTYKAVRSCSVPGRVQVQMEEAFARFHKITSSAEIYFLLEKHGKHFLLLSASSHPDPACTGPNLLETQQ